MLTNKDITTTNPARNQRVPGLLLVFVVLSVLVHSSVLLLSNNPEIFTSEQRFGNMIISTVLVTANTLPGDSTPKSKPVQHPKQNSTKPAKLAANKPAIKTTTSVSAAASTHAFTKIPEQIKLAASESRTATKENFSSESQISADTTSIAKQKENQRNYLLGELQNRLSQYLTYPLRARKRGWQGEVIVALHINEQGQLNKPQLAQSSGHALLDYSAIDAVGKLQRISLPTHLGPPQAMDLLLPIHYQLQEG